MLVVDRAWCGRPSAAAREGKPGSVMANETISDADMEHLKLLARLALTPEETAAAREDLNSIFRHFETLQALDTAGLPELTRPIDLVNVLRPDEPQAPLSQAEALSLGVSVANGFYRVPKVIDQ